MVIEPTLPGDTVSLNVSLFVHSFRGGGAEKMMVRIANELHHRGHDVEVVLVQASGPYESLVDPNVQTTEIGGRNILEIQYNLWSYLRENETDVLLSTMEIPNIVSVIATRYPHSVPVVLRVANFNSKKSRHGKYRLIPPLKRLTYPWAESIITVSDDVGRDVANITAINENTMTTIYNPTYDPDIYEKSQQPVDHEWLTDHDKTVAIAVGKMTPQKDFSTVIKAVSTVNKWTNLHLIILGGGDLEDELKRLARELKIRDRVSFSGFVDNPYAYMAKADIFVLSSRWEGCPNVLIEAMACETPVVCTDCPGGPAEILNKGTYGPLVPVGDEEKMAAAIQDVLIDPPDTSALKDRAAAFDVKVAVDSYEKVLLSVAK